MNEYFCSVFRKKINLFFILFSLLFFFYCSSPEQKNADILDEKKMQEVLMDLNFAESSIEMQNQHSDSSKILLLKYYRQILHHHQITPQQLFNSFDYYLLHPDKMDAMYQDMINELSKKELELKK